MLVYLCWEDYSSSGRDDLVRIVSNLDIAEEWQNSSPFRWFTSRLIE